MLRLCSSRYPAKNSCAFSEPSTYLRMSAHVRHGAQKNWCEQGNGPGGVQSGVMRAGGVQITAAAVTGTIKSHASGQTCQTRQLLTTACASRAKVCESASQDFEPYKSESRWVINFAHCSTTDTLSLTGPQLSPDASTKRNSRCNPERQPLKSLLLLRQLRCEDIQLPFLLLLHGGHRLCPHKLPLWWGCCWGFNLLLLHLVWCCPHQG